MPWLSIIMALLAFFTSKKANPGNKAAALLAAAAVGGGTYYATHETDWGKANLGQLDGVVVPGKVTYDADGNAVPEGYTSVVGKNGTSTLVPIPGFTSVAADVLKSWGGTGTAAVIGTTAVATSSSLQKYLPLLLIGGALLLLTR